MKSNLLSGSAVLVFLALFFTQCTDRYDRYENPPWLGGTNIETLEKEGNYDHFLALMDKADYRNSIENQLFTLFVPTDSAFEAYFASVGISSVEDMTVNEAEEIFGLHILINPRSREQLMYEYAWEELQDPRGEYGTLFHRKRTYSVPQDYLEEVKYFEEFKDQTIPIYRRNTFLPLFTTEYFEDYFGDPNGSDYLFLYPESSWSGTQWHDAMVTEAEVRTSSGFIYYIDRVVTTPPSIDMYLKENQDDFSIFYDFAQRFAEYGSPQFDEQDVRRYSKSYNQILDIADITGPGSGTETWMLYMFSAYIPRDDVLQEWLDNTVYKTYDNIDSVPKLFMVFLLQSHLADRLALPSKMAQTFQNYYGDKIEIDPDVDIAYAHMCSNGPVFAMNKVLEPNAFTCVPGPLFYNKNYTTFLYALQYSNKLTTLTQPSINSTLFAPSNDELLEYGIRENTDLDGEVFLQIRKSSGVWTSMETVDIEEFVGDYIYIGNKEDFAGEGFLQMESDNYVYYNNGVVYGGGNQEIGDEVLVMEKVPSEKNGNMYYVDNTIKRPPNAAEYILADPELSSFKDLLYEAELIDSIQLRYEDDDDSLKIPRVRFISDELQWTVFAPSNDALAQAELDGIVPHDSTELLQKFIYYHFAKGTISVFDDGEYNGKLPSYLEALDTISGNVKNPPLEFINSVNNLGVMDLTGNTVYVDPADANRLIQYGSLHKIDAVLRYEE